MNVVLVEPFLMLREVIAACLSAPPTLVARGCASLTDASLTHQAEPAGVIVVTESCCSSEQDINGLAEQLRPHQVVLLDDHYSPEREQSAQTHLAGYACKERNSLAELKALLLSIDSHDANDFAQDDQASESAISSLTPRELQVLKMVARGFSVQECADKLNIKHSTVDNHKSRMMAKLNIHKSIQLVYFAVREGLISIEEEMPVDSARSVQKKARRKSQSDDE
jgi:DNA-binding NarL/FixJ family response regulator